MYFSEAKGGTLQRELWGVSNINIEITASFGPRGHALHRNRLRSQRPGRLRRTRAQH